VAVIGAGIVRLVTAKVLRDDGFDVVVVEKVCALGGVWIESRTYPGLRTNNSRDTYGFTDHPYSSSADLFPTAEQVREYLASYVQRFGLEPLLRLSAEVVKVSHQSAGFEVETRSPEGLTSWPCDFVVVCAGVFSEPQLPEIERADRFAGTLLHSSQGAMIGPSPHGHGRFSGLGIQAATPDDRDAGDGTAALPRSRMDPETPGRQLVL
jgi:dimethylaniline monooxygenase (N-oxide forming)